MLKKSSLNKDYNSKKYVEDIDLLCKCWIKIFDMSFSKARNYNYFSDIKTLKIKQNIYRIMIRYGMGLNKKYESDLKMINKKIYLFYRLRSLKKSN